MIAKITNAMKSTIQKIQTTLMKPEVKKAGTEQIWRKAKNRIWNSKALAVFTLKMTGAFALVSKKISSILWIDEV